MEGVRPEAGAPDVARPAAFRRFAATKGGGGAAAGGAVAYSGDRGGFCMVVADGLLLVSCPVAAGDGDLFCGLLRVYGGRDRGVYPGCSGDPERFLCGQCGGDAAEARGDAEYDVAGYPAGVVAAAFLGEL